MITFLALLLVAGIALELALLWYEFKVLTALSKIIIALLRES